MICVDVSVTPLPEEIQTSFDPGSNKMPKPVAFNTKDLKFIDNQMVSIRKFFNKR